MDLKQLITTARNEGSSEIHLKVGAPPMVRQRKFLKKLNLPALQTPDLDQIAESMLSPDDKKKFKDGTYWEGNFWGAEPCNFSLNLFKAQGGQICALIRLLSSAIPNFDGIRLPPILGKFLEQPSGLFILSGPPRSGISTSMAALIERINQTRSAHILLIEDQTDFFFQPKKSRITQRQLKKDLMSVEAGINFAKRMDIDALVIGDLKRDLPFKSIFDYVNGGHFVMLTMQTLGVQTTLEKIINFFPETEVDYAANILGHDLLGVCSQALLVNQLEGKMLPVHEVLVVNSAIKKMLESGKVGQLEHNFKTAGDGSCLFEQDVLKIAKEGKLSKEICDNFLGWYRGLKG